MTARPEENLVTPMPVYVVPDNEWHEEIGLSDFVIVLIRRKWVIFLSLLFSLCLALLYLFVAEPVYRANTYLSPPHQSDIQELLINLSGIVNHTVPDYTPDLVFMRFFTNLNSQGMRRKFFDVSGLADEYAVAEGKETLLNRDKLFSESFNSSIQIEADELNSSVVVASFSYMGPEAAARWLNEFVLFINDRTAQQLLNDVNIDIQLEIKRSRRQLGTKLLSEKKRRSDRIEELKEALQVADTLGITNSTPLSVLKSGGGIEVNTGKLPLYMRGTKVLKEEIKVLEMRKTDVPFVSGYRELEAKIFLLEEIQLNVNNMTVVNVDAVARVPYKSAYPNKAKVIVLALALGFLIGILIIFFAEVSSKVRE